MNSPLLLAILLNKEEKSNIVKENSNFSKEVSNFF